MRRFTISLLAVLVLNIASVGGALGHVHGITPLNCPGSRPRTPTPAAAGPMEHRLMTPPADRGRDHSDDDRQRSVHAWTRRRREAFGELLT